MEDLQNILSVPCFRGIFFISIMASKKWTPANFPSPALGASFLFYPAYQPFGADDFPSPALGASFLFKEGFYYDQNRNYFPSPALGASFL